MARNIGANLAGQLALLALALLAARLVFRHLGPDALGVVLFVQTLNVVLAGILDLGLPATVIREIAGHQATDRREIVDLVRTAASCSWALFATTAGGLVLVAPWIAGHWVHLATIDGRRATMVIQVLGVAGLTILPRTLYAGVLRGLQRMVLTNAIDVATAIVQQLIIVLILVRGGGLFAVVAWMSTAYGLATATYLVATAALITPRIALPGWSWAVVRRQAHFSVHMLLITALGVIHTYLDKLTVSKLLSAASLGVYTVAGSVVARGALASTAVADAAYPAFASLYRQGLQSRMAARYWQLHDAVCYLTLPLYAAAIFASLPLFTALFGPGTAASLLLPVTILSFGYYANGTLTILYVYTLAVGKPQLTTRFSSLAVLITVPLTVAGVARFGLSGASFGFLAYHLLFYVVALPGYSRACPGIPARRWYLHLARVTAAGGVTYGLAWLGALHFGLSLPALLAGYLAGSAAFAVAAVRLIGPELREALGLLSHPTGRLSDAA